MIRRFSMVAAAIVTAAALMRGQTPIVMDGAFADWNHLPVAVRDPADAASGNVDFGVVKVVADARSLSLAVDLGQVMYRPDETWMVLVDGDASASSGHPTLGLDGVDIVVEFSPTVWRGTLRRFTAGPGSKLGPGSALGLDTAPDYAHAWRELRIDRSTASLISQRARIKLASVRGSQVLDETNIIEVTLPSHNPAPNVPDPETDPLARPPGTDLRVVVWNVFGFPNRAAERQRHPAFQKVLSALDADVLLLNEVDGSAADLQRWLPARRGADAWSAFTRGELVVVSKVGEITKTFGRPFGPLAIGFYPTLYELIFGRARVNAIGAVVRSGARRILVVPLHLPCCAEAEERLAYAPALRDAVRTAVASVQPDAVLVGGDFNLLIQRDPLDIVQQGVIHGGLPLKVVEAVQLDGLTNATYQGGQQFPPSRLDWLTYSHSTLNLLHAFVFEAADLSPAWLARHGLEAQDSDQKRTSDHRPIVADFRWRR